jgi:hypothetical protein
MVRRRRTILIACGVLAVVVGLAGWFGSRGGRAEVKIVFVGFTNDVFLAQVLGKDGQTEWETNLYAVILVTNTGTAALFPYDSWSREVFLSGAHHAGLERSWIPGPIDAGRSRTCKIWLNPYVQVTRRDVSFKGWGLRDRLRSWLYRHNGRSLGDKLAKPPDTNSLIWATTGWITNPPASR